MKKSLIVYFSHRKENYVAGAIKDLKIGNTEVIAKKVQAIIGAELFEIHPLHEYPSKYFKREFRAGEISLILSLTVHIYSRKIGSIAK